MKKYLIPVIALTFIPSIAFASWWNPASWSIWDMFFNNQNNVPVTQSISIQATTTSSSTEPFSMLTISNETASQTPVIKSPTPIVNPPMKVSMPTVINTSTTSMTAPATASNVAQTSLEPLPTYSKAEFIAYFTHRTNDVFGAVFQTYLDRSFLTQSSPDLADKLEQCSSAAKQAELLAIELNVPPVQFSDLLVKDQNLISHFADDVSANCLNTEQMSEAYNSNNYGLVNTLSDEATTQKITLNDLKQDLTDIGDNTSYIKADATKYFGLMPTNY